MFREMRRKKQLLTEKESTEILMRGSFGVLSLSGDGGYPYSVPLNYVYCPGRQTHQPHRNDKIFFHSANSGHKIDAIRNSPKASFCVTAESTVIPAEYTTYYQSVIVFGEIRILEEDSEKRAAIEQLAQKYAPGDVSGRNLAIEQSWKNFCILELTPHHITGKGTLDLLQKKQQKHLI